MIPYNEMNKSQIEVLADFMKEIMTKNEKCQSCILYLQHENCCYFASHCLTNNFMDYKTKE